MSVVTPPVAPLAGPVEEGRKPLVVLLAWLAAGFLLFSLVRVITGAHDMDSSGALRASLIGAVPIALAGLGGLWSERAGVVNIGLEGMIVLGALGAGYFTYHYGIWVGLLGGILLGILGAAVHALATVVFGVDHIVSGVAINIIAPGLAAYLAETLFTELPGGGPTQSPPLDKPPMITIDPVVDWAEGIQEKHWFVISDLASLLAASVDRLSVVTILALLLVGATALILWRTPFGLRIRSVGESPSAAESLGVNVYRSKFIAVLVSGGLAGLGGAYLATVSSSGYQNGISQNIGYIGLAAMIFGNWRPGLMLAGAALFGYTRTLQLRGGTDSLHALLLFVAIVLAVLAVVFLLRQKPVRAVVLLVSSVLFALWYFTTDSVPREFTGMAPYVATLLVLAFAAQRLRMPAADGQIYRKGSAG